jgi:hypothetical protein
MDQHVCRAIERLGYDFSRFTLQDFIEHVIACRQGRPIIVLGWPLERDPHGAWVKARHADYILYDNTLHYVHQEHVILHEVGHIVLGHRGDRLDKVLPPELWEHIPSGLQAGTVGHLRVGEKSQTPEDYEAETFATQVQQRNLTAQRMAQFTGPSSSIDAVEQFTRHLGYND